MSSTLATQWTAAHGKLLLGVAMDPHEIGQRIAQARVSKGWTQMDFAIEAHVSLSTVTRWESGKLPPVRELIRVAGVLEVAPEELVEPNPTPDSELHHLREEVAEVKEMVAQLLEPSSARRARRASN